MRLAVALECTQEGLVAGQHGRLHDEAVRVEQRVARGVVVVAVGRVHQCAALGLGQLAQVVARARTIGEERLANVVRLQAGGRVGAQPKVPVLPAEEEGRAEAAGAQPHALAKETRDVEGVAVRQLREVLQRLPAVRVVGGREVHGDDVDGTGGERLGVVRAQQQRRVDGVVGVEAQDPLADRGADADVARLRDAGVVGGDQAHLAVGLGGERVREIDGRTIGAAVVDQHQLPERIALPHDARDRALECRRLVVHGHHDRVVRPMVPRRERHVRTHVKVWSASTLDRAGATARRGQTQHDREGQQRPRGEHHGRHDGPAKAKPFRRGSSRSRVRSRRIVLRQRSKPDKAPHQRSRQPAVCRGHTHTHTHTRT